MSISSHVSHQTDNDAECESVSEAGDIGDRALPSRRLSERSSFRLSFEDKPENGAFISVELRNSSVKPLPPELASVSPLSTDAVLASEEAQEVS